YLGQRHACRNVRTRLSSANARLDASVALRRAARDVRLRQRHVPNAHTANGQGPSLSRGPHAFRRRQSGDARSRTPLRGTMIEITLQDGDRIEWALKSFKRKVIQSGLFAELRRRRHYVKP